MKFKTNIKCNGCVQKVQPALDKLAGTGRWSVDLDSPDRILHIEGEQIDEKEVIEALRSAGYTGVRIE